MNQKVDPVTFEVSEEKKREFCWKKKEEELKSSAELIHIRPNSEMHREGGYNEVTICGNCKVVADTYVNSVFLSQPCINCGSRSFRPRYSAKWIKTSKWWQIFTNEGYWKFADY